jgi:hypothetical protein
MHLLINDAAAKIKEGHRYEDRRRESDLLKDYECEFRLVRPDRYEGFFNYAIWYYHEKEFPALQLVWPDFKGKFPWENDFEERFKKDQIILYCLPGAAILPGTLLVTLFPPILCLTPAQPRLKCLKHFA